MYTKTNNSRSKFGGRSNTSGRSNGGGGGYRGRSSNNSRPRKSGYGRNKQQIDPRKFVKAAKPTNAVEVEPEHVFADFNFHPAIHSNIARKGFTKPTAIQDQTIKHAMAGKDVIGIADTGTGKTAAFALPILHRLVNDQSASAIIIAPTRELAQQIEAECRDFSTSLPIRSATLIGGQPMYQQIKRLRANPNIVIGTPGRIKDHVERGNLRLDKFNMLVLDEVDRMLDMGFLPDISSILSKLSSTRQSFFFSATLDRKIDTLVNSFLNDPVRISVKTGSTSDNVAQDVLTFRDSKEKIEKLHSTLILETTVKTLVFEDTRRSVDRLSKELQERGFKADIIHGGKTQGQRQRALRKFKDNQVNVLVATDVAARGIDIADITHVINYSVPQTYDDYTHRIGRAGRAGRVGQALTFVKQ